MTTFKPQLASDVVLEKLPYPLVGQPKIDGVRGLHMNGKFCGRSMKRFANLHTNKLFDVEEFAGFDGELAAESITHPRLCSLTTSALSTIKGQPEVIWWLFDNITDNTCDQGYWDRYQVLTQRVQTIKRRWPELGALIQLVPSYTINSEEDVLSFNDWCLDQGYEGIILRKGDVKHKSGRSTVKETGLLRHKIFDTEEAIVHSVVEGRSNQNALTTNELGYAERSTHAENMVPNGLVGKLICKDVKTGKDVDVAAGKMTHEDRALYLRNPELIVGKIIKYQHFSKGVKEKRRFPTYQCLRDPVDMGE